LIDLKKKCGNQHGKAFTCFRVVLFKTD